MIFRQLIRQSRPQRGACANAVTVGLPEFDRDSTTGRISGLASSRRLVGGFVGVLFDTQRLAHERGLLIDFS